MYVCMLEATQGVKEAAKCKWHCFSRIFNISVPFSVYIYIYIYLSQFENGPNAYPVFGDILVQTDKHEDVAVD